MSGKPTRRRIGFRPHVWLQRHAQVALASLGRLVHLPLSTLMTSAVIGIALALPIGLHIMLDNLQQVTQGWESGASISLFLRQQVSDQQATQLANQLRLHQRIDERVRFEDCMSRFNRLMSEN